MLSYRALIQILASLDEGIFSFGGNIYLMNSRCRILVLYLRLYERYDKESDKERISL